MTRPLRFNGLALLSLLAVGSSAMAQPGAAPAPVKVASVIERDIAAGQAFVGTVMPTRVSSVGSAVDGRVIDFPVNEGDRVSKGQVLAQLLTGQLDIQLAGAKAELELRKHALEELQNGSRPEEIEQAKARYLSSQAAAEYAAARLDRTRRLYERGSITPDEYQQATSQANQATQAAAEAKAAYDLTVAGPRRETIAQAAARVAVQEEEIRAIEDQLAKHTIRSPFDGYVVSEFTEIGHWVAKAGLVAKVVELDQVDVEIMVLESYVPALRIGQTVRVEIPALGAEPIEGQVAIVVPQADARSRSFPVKVRIKNQFSDEQPLIRAGMFARVMLPVGTVGEALLVPKDSIVLGGPTPVVFVVDPDPKDPAKGTARRVNVQLGIADGGLIEVKGELRAGQKVVVLGNERLRAPAPVQILPDSKAAASGRTNQTDS
jgi:RND family efflux transporter MFP subunit